MRETFLTNIPSRYPSKYIIHSRGNLGIIFSNQREFSLSADDSMSVVSRRTVDWFRWTGLYNFFFFRHSSNLSIYLSKFVTKLVQPIPRLDLLVNSSMQISLFWSSSPSEPFVSNAIAISYSHYTKLSVICVAMAPWIARLIEGSNPVSSEKELSRNCNINGGYLVESSS